MGENDRGRHVYDVYKLLMQFIVISSKRRRCVNILSSKDPSSTSSPLPYPPHISHSRFYPSVCNSATRVPCQMGPNLVDWAVISCVHSLKRRRRLR